MNTKNLIFSKDLMQWYSDRLLNWFYQAKRSLPFRENKNPYCIWISEIMAQQTQIDTLLPYYQRFIRAFPDVAALAAAPLETVLKYWEGLGYYSRARNLHRAAQIIMETHHGQFPSSYKELITLPGIGPYTGGAIASIAFNEKVPAVDGNVLRVISRFHDYHGDIAENTTKKAIAEWVTSALPDRPGDFNEALMELGALICSPSSPKCMLCPVQERCQALHHGTIDQLPVKTKKIRQKRLTMEVGIVSCQSELFFIRRPKTGLLASLWGFPIIEKDRDQPDGSTILQLLQKRFPGLQEGTFIGRGKHVFSHIIWEMEVYHFHLLPERVSEAHPLSDTECFISLDHLEAIALPVAFSKLLSLL